MNHHPQLGDLPGGALAALERASVASDVVIVDVDRVLLARPAERELLGVLRRSGVIGPLQLFAERQRARRAAGGKSEPSARSTVGLGRDDLVRLVDELAADLHDTAHGEMASVIDHHVDDGDFVVLATDAPQEFATALAREFGAHRGCGTIREVVAGAYSGNVVQSAAGRGRSASLVRAIGRDGLDSATSYPAWGEPVSTSRRRRSSKPNPSARSGHPLLSSRSRSTISRSMYND